MKRVSFWKFEAKFMVFSILVVALFRAEMVFPLSVM